MYINIVYTCANNIEHSDTLSINEELSISDESRWWNPLSKLVLRKEKNVTYTGKSEQNLWIFGLQTYKKSGQILKHNYWFYYYVITAMLASIYIFILSVNLFMLIPYSSISKVLIGISTFIFFATFIGLMVFMIYIDGYTESIIPTDPLPTEIIVGFICVPMVVFLVGITILAQYELRPLIMVGISLIGIDLIIFWHILGLSHHSQNFAIKLE